MWRIYLTDEPDKVIFETLSWFTMMKKMNQYASLWSRVNDRHYISFNLLYIMVFENPELAISKLVPPHLLINPK